MISNMTHRLTRGSSWLLIAYLSLILSSCANRPQELTPAEARLLQTREFNGSPEEVAKAASMVLQEMHYTLDNVDMGLGIMTASRNTEHALAPISREVTPESEAANELGTFCLIAGSLAVVGLFLAWIFDAFDDNDDEDDDDQDRDRDNRRGHRSSRRDRSHHHETSSVTYIETNSSSYEPHSYTYTLTMNFQEISLQQTRVRLTVQGEHYQGSNLVETGPVQDQQFYVDFYTRLYEALNR